MVEKIKIFFSILLKNKKFIFLFFTAFLISLIIAFPFNEMNDFVTTQISKATDGKVFLQFDKFHFNPIKSEVGLEQLEVEAGSIPKISASALLIRPAISALFTQKPYGELEAQELWNGRVLLKSSGGKRSENGAERQQINMTIEQMSLSPLKDFIKLPFDIKGRLQADLSSQTDLTFSEQPEAEINSTIQNLELSNLLFDFQGMSLQLPDLNLKVVDLKGRLTGGRLFIDSLKLGQEPNDIQGQIKGDIMFNIQSHNGALIPQLGAYNFQVELKVKTQFLKSIEVIDLMIGTYKQTTNSGATYKFKVSGDSFQNVPQFTRLN